MGGMVGLNNAARGSLSLWQGLHIANMVCGEVWQTPARPRAVCPSPSSGTFCMLPLQDSTTLWEQCLPGVMDKALGLHHALIRRLAIQHAGYESATEVGSLPALFLRARAS